MRSTDSKKRNSEPSPPSGTHFLCPSSAALLSARSAPDLREDDLSPGSRSSSPGTPNRSKYPTPERRKYRRRRRRTSAGSVGRRASVRNDLEFEDPWLEFRREHISPQHSPLHYHSVASDNKNCPRCRYFTGAARSTGPVVTFGDVVKHRFQEQIERRRSTSSCPAGSSTEAEIPLHLVRVLGSHKVGKSSLIRQFTTSPVLYSSAAADYAVYRFDNDRLYDSKRRGSLDRTSSSETEGSTTSGSVSVSLDGKEADVVFEEVVETKITSRIFHTSDALIVVYSVTEPDTFIRAERILQQIKQLRQDKKQQTALGALFRPTSKAVLLVGNKADLARRRLITTDEGRAVATKYDTKFIETSTFVGHNVDELLVGTIKQIRLKARSGSVPTSCRLAVPIGPPTSPSTARNLCHKARGLIYRLLQRCDKCTHSCDNLNIV